MLCEYCEGGSLVNYLMKHSCLLAESQIVDCMLQICDGLGHMHSLGIAHRDLKVENILVSYDEDSMPLFKIGDFGSATKDHSIDYQQAPKREIGKFLGRIEKQCTRMYRAPEMLDQYQGFNVDGCRTDVWMLGCVLYVLATGNRHPF